jgi:hypothetical protein
MSSTTQRISSVLAHLNPLSENGREKLLKKNADDIVRTMGKARVEQETLLIRVR